MDYRPNIIETDSDTVSEHESERESDDDGEPEAQRFKPSNDEIVLNQYNTPSKPTARQIEHIAQNFRDYEDVKNDVLNDGTLREALDDADDAYWRVETVTEHMTNSIQFDLDDY